MTQATAVRVSSMFVMTTFAINVMKVARKIRLILVYSTPIGYCNLAQRDLSILHPKFHVGNL